MNRNVLRRVLKIEIVVACLMCRGRFFHIWGAANWKLRWTAKFLAKYLRFFFFCVLSESQNDQRLHRWLLWRTSRGHSSVWPQGNSTHTNRGQSRSYQPALQSQPYCYLLYVPGMYQSQCSSIFKYKISSITAHQYSNIRLVQSQLINIHIVKLVQSHCFWTAGYSCPHLSKANVHEYKQCWSCIFWKFLYKGPI